MIPQIIHQIWLGDPMPDHLREYCQTWRDKHPRWMYILWTDVVEPPLCKPPPDNLINQELFDNAKRWAPKAVGQFKSDILRYELLYRYGGVYVDCDFECKKPLDDLLTNSVKLFAAWETPGQWIGNAILGSIPGHPLMDRVIRGLPDNVNKLAGPDVRPNQLTGPQYLTRLWKSSFYKVDGDKIFSNELFYPYLYNELDKGTANFPKAYAVHHWNNKRQGQPV